MMVDCEYFRYLVISRPLLTVQSANMKRRARLMITIAWVLSTILASCQALMWRYLLHLSDWFT